MDRPWEFRGHAWRASNADGTSVPTSVALSESVFARRKGAVSIHHRVVCSRDLRVSAKNPYPAGRGNAVLQRSRSLGLQQCRSITS